MLVYEKLKGTIINVGFLCLSSLFFLILLLFVPYS